jgi:acyl-CoA dehydrogenase
MSAAFALVADAASLLLGGALKKKERLSARLADIFSQLYLASAALKRFEDQGKQQDDLPFLCWACEEALHTIQTSLDEILENFPDPIISRVLRFLVFPLGQTFSLPKDKLDHKVADLIFSPGPARDRLTEGIFLPKKDQMLKDEPLWKLEDALEKVINAEPIEKKIREAERKGLLKKGDLEKELEDAVRVDVLTEEEVKILRASFEARNEVIRVDDFPQKKGEKGKG